MLQLFGCFSPEKIKDKNGNETEASYSQKASALLATLLQTEQLKTGDFHRLFDSLSFETKASQDFLDFITPKGKKKINDNLSLLLELEETCPGIFSKAMTDFEKVKSYRTTLADDGTTKRVPWEDALKKFFLDNKYIGITPENEDIAEVLGSKGVKQEVFDEAVSLREEAKTKDIQEHLLGEKLKESSILESIEQLKEQTAQELSDAKRIIEDLYRKNFTFEWLSKNDAHNAIMGLFASCCGSITSHAYGKNIARASILAEDVQNLVVRDYKGEIISKGTMYLNKQQRYAVLNDFELNRTYRNHENEPGRYNVNEKSREEQTRQMIFDTFMRGLLSFVQKYDEQNPEKPLKQINVGMGFNRLKKQVEEFDKATKNLTIPVEYGFKDASGTQYILYENSKKAELMEKYFVEEEKQEKTNNTDKEK